MQSSLDYVFYAGLLLFTSGANGEVTIPPMNRAAEVGGQTVFDCTSDASSPNWVFSTNREEFEAPSGQNIVIGCMVQPAFATHYDVDRLGGSSNKCNLIVKAITLQQAGVYTCTDITSRLSSVLTVIARNTSIAVSSQPQTVEGDTVTMSYTVIYNSSIASSITPTIKPVLSWTDSDGNIVTSSPVSTANSVSSSISVTAGRQDILQYTCHISYTSPSTKPSFASNTPSSVSNSPSTSTINVLYATKIESITKTEAVLSCPGDAVMITCIASANPPATYSWIDPNSRNYSGETIEAEMNGVYTCTASNLIQGSMSSDTMEQAVNAYSSNIGCRMIIILCIVFGVYFLGNFIATVVFLICYNRKIGFKLKLNDRFTWLRKMLPCMNGNDACRCHWIFLSVCVFALVGMMFIVWVIITATTCSQGRRRSKASKDSHNPSDITDPIEDPEMRIHSSTLGPNGDDTYERINEGRHRASQDDTKKGKDQKEQQSGKGKGKGKGKEKSINKKKNQSPPNADTVSTTPSSPSPNQQPTTAQGPVYSDLPVADRNVQPEQYIAGNMDNNYSELKKT